MSHKRATLMPKVFAAPYGEQSQELPTDPYEALAHTLNKPPYKEEEEKGK